MPPVPGKPPSHVGRYEVLAELGRGAMGIVYKARDPRIDRIVALKTLAVPPGADVETARHLRDRFLNEGRAAGRLNHAGIVTVYDADEDEATGTAYLAMEFVEGDDLKALMARGLPDPRFMQILAEVASALDHAHARGVIHRDVKPANILVAEDGHAKLTDFGIARLQAQNLTMAGQFLGSPAYMSPEQIRGAPVTHATDLFSLGVVIYEGLTGMRPFEGDDLIGTGHAITHARPRRASDIRRSISPQVDVVLEKALAKLPTERFSTAGEMVEALRLALGLEPLAPTPAASGAHPIALQPAAAPQPTQPPVVAAPPPSVVAQAPPAPRPAAPAAAAEPPAAAPSPEASQALPVVEPRSPLPYLAGAAIVIALGFLGWALSQGDDAPLPPAPTSASTPAQGPSISKPSSPASPASRPATAPVRPAPRRVETAPVLPPPVKGPEPADSAPAPAPVTAAKGRLEVSVATYHSGTLVVRDGDFVILRERMAANRSKGRARDTRPPATYGVALPSGPRKLEFTFMADDRTPMQQSVSQAIPAGGTARASLTVGGPGRDMELIFQ